MNNSITLEQYLEENSKLPVEHQLGKDKIKILLLAKKYCSTVDRIKKGNTVYWELSFDDGAYKGDTSIRLSRKELNPLALLNALNSINWPGFQTIVSECCQAILPILEKYQ